MKLCLGKSIGKLGKLAEVREEQIMRTPLEDIQIEISGCCNALCPYCVTGQKNNMGEKTGGMLEPEKFREALDVLTRKGLIGQNTVISLYNYGEPLLNPQFGEIIGILESRGMGYEYSTNASILPSEELVRKMNGLQYVQFSMCGTSQASYDRIHGFSCSKIMENIEKMVSLLHKHHPEVECILKLQMYKFNEAEYNSALEFSVRNKMTVIPLHALFANLEQQMEFIEGYQAAKAGLKTLGDSTASGDLSSLDAEIVTSAGATKIAVAEESEQLWYYLPKLFAMPELQECPQWDSMVVDENLDVALCCMITKSMPGYKLSDVYSVDEAVLGSRKNNPLCKRCMDEGTARSICLTPSYRRNIYYNEILERLLEEDVVVIGEGPLQASFRTIYPRFRGSPAGDVCNVSKYKEMGKFIVLADRTWWNKIDILKSQGLKERRDYLVYNTYLRGEV